MTILINDELLNRLLRDGEGAAGLSALPRIDEMIDAKNRLAQRGDWVPLLDALRATVQCARRLQSVSDTKDCAVGVDRSALEQLLVAMIRLETQAVLAHVERPATAQPEHLRMHLRSCHQAAVDIADRLWREPRMPFERISSMLGVAPDRPMTLQFLARAGGRGAAIFDDKGELAPIVTALPQTVPADTKVRLLVRILRVDDPEHTAVVRRLKVLDQTSESVLAHHPMDCALRFDGDSIERDDLTAAQYLDVPLKIRAAAECAVVPSAARRSSLTLLEVLEARDVMDELHKQARPFEKQLRLALE